MPDEEQVQVEEPKKYTVKLSEDAAEEVEFEALENAYKENVSLKEEKKFWDKQWRPEHDTIHKNKVLKAVVEAYRAGDLDADTEKIIDAAISGKLKGKPKTAEYLKFAIDSSGDDEMIFNAYNQIMSQKTEPEFDNEEDRMKYYVDKKEEALLDKFKKENELTKKELETLKKEREQEKQEQVTSRYQQDVIGWINEAKAKSGVTLSDEIWNKKIGEEYYETYGENSTTLMTQNRVERIIENVVKGLKITPKEEKQEERGKVPEKMNVTSNHQSPVAESKPRFIGKDQWKKLVTDN